MTQSKLKSHIVVLFQQPRENGTNGANRKVFSNSVAFDWYARFVGSFFFFLFLSTRREVITTLNETFRL